MQPEGSLPVSTECSKSHLAVSEATHDNSRYKMAANSTEMWPTASGSTKCITDTSQCDFRRSMINIQITIFSPRCNTRNWTCWPILACRSPTPAGKCVTYTWPLTNPHKKKCSEIKQEGSKWQWSRFASKTGGQLQDTAALTFWKDLLIPAKPSGSRSPSRCPCPEVPPHS